MAQTAANTTSLSVWDNFDALDDVDAIGLTVAAVSSAMPALRFLNDAKNRLLSSLTSSSPEKKTQPLIRDVEEMATTERGNLVLGKVQAALNMLGGANAMIQGVRFLVGLASFSHLSPQEKVALFTRGFMTASFILTAIHLRLAQKKADKWNLQDDKVDHLLTNYEQLGPLPPKDKALHFEWKPTIVYKGDRMVIYYPEAPFSPKVAGIDLKTKWDGVKTVLSRNLTGGLRAFHSGKQVRRTRIRNQYSDANIAGLIGIRKIVVTGISNLPKGNVVMVGLNHYTIIDFVLLNRVHYSLPREKGVGFHEAITMRKGILWVPSLGSRVGLASKRAGNVLIPVGKGAGKGALRDVLTFLHTEDPPQIGPDGIAHLVDRSAWYYGPGHRTIELEDDFEKGQGRILYPPHYGAFNAAVAADLPLVPVSFYYTEDGVAHVHYHRPRYPNEFAGGREIDSDDEKRVREVAAMMQQDVVEEMETLVTSHPYFNRMEKKFYKKRRKRRWFLGGI